MVRVENERSQLQNKVTALEVLRSRLAQVDLEKSETSRNEIRKGMVGAGMRGDKRRTIAMQRDQVVDHVTGKRMTVKAYLAGDIDLLW